VEAGGKHPRPDRLRRLQRDDALDVRIGLRLIPLGPRRTSNLRQRRGRDCVVILRDVRGDPLLDRERWLVIAVIVGDARACARRIFRDGARERRFDPLLRRAVGGLRVSAAFGSSKRLVDLPSYPPLLHPVVDEHAGNEYTAGSKEDQLERGHAR